jgi:hypothetical protein
MGIQVEIDAEVEGVEVTTNLDVLGGRTTKNK